MSPQSANGFVSKASNHSVDETVEKLKGMLQAKGITLFALVDHSGEAEKIGIKMPSTKLLIFGNPKGGTPLMLASPSIAIDLPLKLLVWERPCRKSPDFVQQRRISERAPRTPAGAAAKHRHHRNARGQRRSVKFRSHLPAP
jgi:uncharacterized protein (DUF302 family)